MNVRTRLAGLSTVVLLASGCAAYTDAPAAAGPPTTTATLRVSAAAYPFAFVTERVGGDLVEVTNLTAPGAEPHDVELTPQQVAALASDDLVVVQSGFQPAVDTAIEQAAPRRVLDAATFLTLLPGDAEEDGEHEGEDHEGHDHGGLDPHTWLDPTNLVAVAEHVRDALAEARPEAAADLEANTAALVADLTALDAELTDQLTGCRIEPFITSHAAFGYLAKRYRLSQVGIRGIDPQTEPTAARIAEVQQVAREHGVTTIFFETLVSPAVAESIAGDLGLATDVLDPLEGITAASRGSDYLEVMRANGTALQKANQCS